MDPDSAMEERRERLKQLAEDPVLKRMRDGAGYMPIWAMSGAAICYFLSDYAIKTNRIAPKSPRLTRFGLILLGLFGGVQAGMWKLRHDYIQLDPKGEKLKEMRDIVMELTKQSRSAPKDGCPKSEIAEAFKGKDEQKAQPKRNQYGDVLEDDPPRT